MRTVPPTTRRAVLVGAPALILSACGDGAALDRLAQGPRAKAVSAPTGDRLLLEGGRTVLLAGVEAPSLDRPFGDAARRALDGIARGRGVELLLSGAEAEGAARPAQVRLSPGRTWVQGALLDAGAVWVRTAADDRALASEMLAREAAARGRRRGLWGLRDYGVRLPDEVEHGERGFRIVEGRVLRAGRFGRTVFLDFARPWRSGVSVHVPTAALRDFRSAGIELEGLEGRLIRVRGMLAWADGAPVLTLDHPEAIEMLADK